MAIPKIIHQTVRAKEGLHPAYVDNIARLKAGNPGWEHRLYDNADIEAFIAGSYGAAMLKTYKRLNPVYGAMLADFFRYLLVYRQGGVYLDIKSSCRESLDAILRADDSYLLSHWRDERWGRYPELGPLGEFQQWHIVAEPAHPFLAAVIERVEANIANYTPGRDGTGRLALFRLTGPIAYTLAIEPVRALHPHRLVDAEAMGFQYTVFGADAPPGAHMYTEKKHYSQMSESLVFLDKPDGAPLAKVARNEPCPCGSGIRYKWCHGKL
ncbi:MAG TPA: glycosyltransferase [Reyranella sp.]|jgi:mannosyltransferase OCH1-like enzyme|nr:glycosyltransferase [Reyranella sp.]